MKTQESKIVYLADRGPGSMQASLDAVPPGWKFVDVYSRARLGDLQSSQVDLFALFLSAEDGEQRKYKVEVLPTVDSDVQSVINNALDAGYRLVGTRTFNLAPPAHLSQLYAAPQPLHVGFFEK